MTKQLYTVRIEAEVVVLAESAAEAETEARYGGTKHELRYSSEPMRHMPTRWNRACLVYGADGDEELGALLDAGLAPEYAGDGPNGGGR